MNDMTDDSLTKRIWMWVLREGGYSTLAEIAHAVGEDRERLSNVIGRQVERGLFQRMPAAGRAKMAYGVTIGCKVPGGVTLQELAEIGVIRTESAA